MSRIKVTNTSIIIDPYILGECEELERIFKVYDPITHSFHFAGLYYDDENKRLYLPAGLDLWKVKSCLKEQYYDRISNTPYQCIEDIKMKYSPRDNDQVEALKFMTGLYEYENNAMCSQLSVNLSTGIGKTYCSIATVSFFKIKSIVITGSNSLLNQWKNNILEYTNLNESDILNINGSDICNMILLGNSKKASNAKIYLCSHGTLRSFGDRYGWDNVSELFKILGIGIKIYDECHTNFDNMVMIDFYTNTFKTYYVTATPGRSNWREDRIFQISLKNVPAIDLFNEARNHTKYIAIKWNSNPSAKQISMCKNPAYGLDRNKYINYVTRKPEFYKMLRIIMDMVKSAINKGGRVLMYIGTNDGILRVYHWIAENYREYIGDIGIFTSLVNKESKLKEREKKILLSTTKSAGLGEHIEGLKMTIVLAEPFKSSILARQSLGRTRDNNTFYIELVDMGFIYCKKFYYAKLPVFNKYATDVSDTIIDSHELDRRSEILEDERDTVARQVISLEDKRFNFDSVLPKKESDITNIKQVVTFHKKSNSKFNNNNIL